LPFLYNVSYCVQFDLKIAYYMNGMKSDMWHVDSLGISIFEEG